MTGSEEEIERRLSGVGRDVLRIFPPEPRASVPMSALYASVLRTQYGLAPRVVAGCLWAGSELAFGVLGPFDGAAVFSGSDVNWDGHAWVTLGPYLIDISLYRTSRSSRAPAALRQVRTQQALRSDFLICKIDEQEALGFLYLPQYVLSEDQIDARALAALSHASRSPSANAPLPYRERVGLRAAK